MLLAVAVVFSIALPSASSASTGRRAHILDESASIAVGPINDVSARCGGQNAEVEQAVGPSGSGLVYEAWSGCRGIGFARSTNSGASFGAPLTLPGSVGSQGDPDVAVGPNGTVYVSFMMSQGGHLFPVVDASPNDGVSFPQVTSLVPPDADNWGDSPNVAVAPDGTVYLSWDYGPSAASVVTDCTVGGSCSFTGGDLNVVVQKSTDDGKTFGPMVAVSPGYPWSGADNGPMVVDASGDVDVVYQDYPTSPSTHSLSPAVNFFTSSRDGGQTWSTPVAVGAAAGTMSTTEWWNEPSIAIDDGGNLYVAWDTQGKSQSGLVDTGWVSYSQDHGVTWSTPSEAPPDQRNVPHIMEVTGGASGDAVVAWLSDSAAAGYALYVRPYSIAGGWLSPAFRVSSAYGNKGVWPGDTFGLSTLDANNVVASWGSATSSTKQAAVYAAEVSIEG